MEQKSKDWILSVLAYLFVTGFVDVANAGGAVELTKENFNYTIANTELVFVNFHVSWCPYSARVTPLFEEAAVKIHEEYPSSKIIFGKVNGEEQWPLCIQNVVTKYPTLKLFRNGMQLKKEYRGERSAKAYMAFVRKEMEMEVVHELEDLEIYERNETKRRFFAFMNSSDSKSYENYYKIASAYKDECTFYVGFGEAFNSARPSLDEDFIKFKPEVPSLNLDFDREEDYEGDTENFKSLKKWIKSTCLTLVREITFENAEELTEEGLPLLILFYKEEDETSPMFFRMLVKSSLRIYQDRINFVTAKGKQFRHPIENHLKKTMDDLPLMAIDSFQHMYLFPNTSYMFSPHDVMDFINDLFSGKLHREFHYGPDEPKNNLDPSTTTTTLTPQLPSEEEAESAMEVEKVEGLEEGEEDVADPTPASTELPTSTPPISAFKKLLPSDTRYTFPKLRLNPREWADEL